MMKIFDHKKSMVGRGYDAAGNDIGDAKFFKRDMGFSQDAESSALDALKNKEIQLALAQVESLAVRDRHLGVKAYKHLIQLYAADPRVNEWRKRMDELSV